MYDKHIEEINSDPIDLLRTAVDNKPEIIDEEDEELLEDDDEDEYRIN